MIRKFERGWTRDDVIAHRGIIYVIFDTINLPSKREDDARKEREQCRRKTMSPRRHRKQVKKEKHKFRVVELNIKSRSS